MGARRRGRGDGSITQRADGRWMARMDLGWQGGRRLRKTLYGRTRAEVRDKLTKAQRELQRGTAPGDERQTIEQFLSRWLQNVARARVRPRTFETYEAVLRRHVVGYLGKRPVARLTPEQVQAWLMAWNTRACPRVDGGTLGSFSALRSTRRCAGASSRRTLPPSSIHPAPWHARSGH